MKKRKIVLIIMLCLTLFSISGCGEIADDRFYPTKVEELDGLRGGALMGTVHDTVIEKNFPNSEILYYNTYADVFNALKNNKVDYCVTDMVKAKCMVAQIEGLTVIEDANLMSQSLGFIFQKDTERSRQLRAELNAFIAECKENGVMAEMEEKWFDNAVDSVMNAKPLDIPLTGENGTVNVALTPTSQPYTLVTGESVSGFDVELLTRFCQSRGYNMEISSSDFSGVIPAVTSGKCDIGAGCITITEERAKSVDFSDSYSSSVFAPIVALRPNDGLSIDALKSSFRRTFIEDNRWVMVLKGIGVTLEIALSAAVIGSILGFLVYLLCRNNKKVLNKIFDAFAWLFSGLPMVVILMILYYIVLVEYKSGTLVAIIAFSISVCLSVYSLLKTSVKSIDAGQLEGAYSLGFTDYQTFFKIVFPQAMTQFLPNYKGTLISMLKGTAIVGYIAVQDLTKVSDIIRSRTYEAFFPIIATAIIYLIMVCIITMIIKRISVHYDPKKRSKEAILRRFGK